MVRFERRLKRADNFIHERLIHGNVLNGAFLTALHFKRRLKRFEIYISEASV